MPGMSEGMNVAIGLQMLMVAIASGFVGWVFGEQLANDGIVKRLKKAAKEGKSLNDVISHLEESEVAV